MANSEKKEIARISRLVEILRKVRSQTTGLSLKLELVFNVCTESRARKISFYAQKIRMPHQQQDCEKLEPIFFALAHHKKTHHKPITNWDYKQELQDGCFYEDFRVYYWVAACSFVKSCRQVNLEI